MPLLKVNAPESAAKVIRAYAAIRGMSMSDAMLELMDLGLGSETGQEWFKSSMEGMTFQKLTDVVDRARQVDKEPGKQGPAPDPKPRRGKK